MDARTSTTHTGGCRAWGWVGWFGPRRPARSGRAARSGAEFGRRFGCRLRAIGLQSQQTPLCNSRPLSCNLQVASSSLAGGFERTWGSRLRLLGFSRDLGLIHALEDPRTDRLPPRGALRILAARETARASPGVYPSGQRGQTVNLLAYAFAGSNPAAPTDPPCGVFLRPDPGPRTVLRCVGVPWVVLQPGGWHPGLSGHGLWPIGSATGSRGSPRVTERDSTSCENDSTN